jgi:hypothetical protein
MLIDVIEHLPCLPCQQTLFSVVHSPFHKLWISLSAQYRGCLEYGAARRAVRRLFLVKLTDGRIEQCYYTVHPVDLHFACLSLHGGGTVSVSERDVDRELQWTKAPPFEGLLAVPCVL